MPDALALVALLLELSDAHHAVGAGYYQLAHHLDPSGAVDEDVMMVARAIQGEGAAMFGARRDEVGEWIAHTAYNYWQRRWWDTDAYRARIADRIGADCLRSEDVEMWMVVATQYNGTRLVDDPEPWAIRLAHRVLEARRGDGADPTSACHFMLSLDDLQNHDWRGRAEGMVRHVISAPDNLARQMWFFRRWPGD